MSDKRIINADAKAAGERAAKAESDYQDSQKRVNSDTYQGYPLGDQSGRRSGAGDAGRGENRNG
jgi:hypothetical protein